MKLYRFRWSPFALKVQAMLDWLGAKYEVIDVAYHERNELAELTGGYVYVPVLLTDSQQVLFDSRVICEHLTREGRGEALLPAPLEGPIWAYHDWVDGPLEDVMFRIGSPAVRRAWPTPGERALYVLIKERKFGSGCVDAWEQGQDQLIERAQKLLAPSLRTLRQQPFLFGASPTLADAALYGNCLMLDACDKPLLPRLSPELVDYAERASKARLPV